MAAPKPLPAPLRLIGGRSPGHDVAGRKVALPPPFKRLPPEAPEWLPDEARAEWDRVSPELARLDITKPVDRSSLTAYCLAWDRLVEAQRIISAEGLLGENSQGRVRHPAVAVLEAASKELRGWASEFGLTPAAEAKLKTQEAGDDEGAIFD